MKKTIILMAAGSGERMNSKIPKQFIEVNGKPILAYTYDVFKKIKDLDICIVLPDKDYSKWKKLLSKFIDESTLLIRGGKVRNISVRNGINSIKSKKGYIGIHDGVRPFLSIELINKLFKEAEKSGNAIPFTQTINSLRRIKDDKSYSVDRSKYIQIQTPQIFNTELIRNALNNIQEKNYNDEASLIEVFGSKVNLVEGEENNIKITRISDLNFFN